MLEVLVASSALPLLNTPHAFLGALQDTLAVALVAAVVAIMGLGAAYTGHFGRPIGRPAFWALNVLSLSLVFADPEATAVVVPLVLAILAWHARRLPQPLNQPVA